MFICKCQAIVFLTKHKNVTLIYLTFPIETYFNNPPQDINPFSIICENKKANKSQFDLIVKRRERRFVDKILIKPAHSNKAIFLHLSVRANILKIKIFSLA